MTVRTYLKWISSSAIVAFIMCSQSARFNTLNAIDDTDGSSSEVGMSLQAGAVTSGIVAPTNLLHLTNATRSPYHREWSTALVYIGARALNDYLAVPAHARGPPRQTDYS